MKTDWSCANVWLHCSWIVFYFQLENSSIDLLDDKMNCNIEKNFCEVWTPKLLISSQVW